MPNSVHYVSTRDPSAAEGRSFEDILLAGLAPDGGLYVPDHVPELDADRLRRWRGLGYADVAAEVLGLFADGFLDPPALRSLTHDAYRGFSHKAVAPLKQIGRDEWLLELFHGPTLAFKDYALQVVGRLFDASLARSGGHVTIVGATSGDTGSAAIEACRDRSSLDIFMLYPDGRPSEVQRRQMTTVDAANAHAIAIDGSFDDCQDLVKALFADGSFRRERSLSAVNSINWARIAAQIAYYFVAATGLGAPDLPVSFAVPTGNFGNVLAAHMARRMGLPIDRLVIGTNRNDILWRYIETGDMRIEQVRASLSPSMDIQVSSNFERLLFELAGRDGSAVERAMTGFRRDGRLASDRAVWQQVRALFQATRLDDEGTRRVIGEIWRETGELVDPHSAVAIAALRATESAPGIPRIALACAHPAKFPDVVEQVTGRRPGLPPHLADLMERPERIHRLPADLGKVRDFIRARARCGASR